MNFFKNFKWDSLQNLPKIKLRHFYRWLQFNKMTFRIPFEIASHFFLSDLAISQLFQIDNNILACSESLILSSSSIVQIFFKIQISSR